MMTETTSENDQSARETSTDFLKKRIDINRTYASEDFDAWLMQRVPLVPGNDVLDVGCGTGAQSLPFSRAVGPEGSVTAIDISQSSVSRLLETVPAGHRLQGVAADMADLKQLIRDRFDIKSYDVAHSSYALYYTPARLEVLDAMTAALKPGGRLIIFTPNLPHGLVELAKRFTKVPANVTDSLEFGPKVLEPYFSKTFKAPQIHHFHNILTIPDAETVIEFYRQTTYYDAQAETPMREYVEAVVRKDGHFRYEKNGYLIIGHFEKND